MKTLILGGSGMLGHKLWQAFTPRFETWATVRRLSPEFAGLGISDRSRVIDGITVEDIPGLERALAAVRPDVVVNCIGLVKQDAAANDLIANLTVNAIFPHHVARLCRTVDARLIHLSTDCVFSGRTGNYSEADVPEAEDLYGRTKLLGEVDGEQQLTIRTSMIGRELASHRGLLEWLLSRDGRTVRGFTRAVFSGFTTIALAELLGEIILHHAALSGVWHVAADPITKFDLLSLIKEVYHLSVTIEPDEAFVCDRSLDGSRFRTATRLAAPAWPDMIQSMYTDPTPYHQLQRTHAGG